MGLEVVLVVVCVQRTSFVWGGCMLLRRHHLNDDDPQGVLRVGMRRVGSAHNPAGGSVKASPRDATVGVQLVSK